MKSLLTEGAEPSEAREIWRSVPSLPGVIASSWGRIMLVPFIHSGTQGAKQYGGNPIYGQWDGDRYVWVWRGKTRKVARLVCEAFHGPPPPDRTVCMHLDENSRNNRPENLAWGTQKENLNAPGFLDYCRGRIGENSPTIKGRKKVA
jgi:hypothetical protein